MFLFMHDFLKYELNSTKVFIFESIIHLFGPTSISQNGTFKIKNLTIKMLFEADAEIEEIIFHDVAYILTGQGPVCFFRNPQVFSTRLGDLAKTRTFSQLYRQTLILE